MNDKMNNKTILTVREIIDLARFAGIPLEEHRIAQALDSELEDEIAIFDCPEGGVVDEEGVSEKFRKLAYFAEYPDEGGVGLGEKL